MKKALVSCNVYVSEGRSKPLIAAMRSIAQAAAGVTLVTSFVDAPYHRSSYTLAGAPAPVLRAAVSMCEHALQHVDLTEHEATHPRIGVVDHISVHPLLGISLGALGEQVRGELGGSIGAELDLPVLLYGSAHPDGKSLAGTWWH